MRVLLGPPVSLAVGLNTDASISIARASLAAFPNFPARWKAAPAASVSAKKLNKIRRETPSQVKSEVLLNLNLTFCGALIKNLLHFVDLCKHFVSTCIQNAALFSCYFWRFKILCPSCATVCVCGFVCVAVLRCLGNLTRSCASLKINENN